MRPDPYRVWLSEVMLQQTTVAAVKPYFETFLARWPAVGSLAAAPRDDVMKAWAGLGYYARARNLQACAEVVVRDHGGRFPHTAAGLKALPGIGDYTAAAIARDRLRRSGAGGGRQYRAGARAAVRDRGAPPRGQGASAQRQARLTPRARAGDYAQAMMDLGAAICTPKAPACSLCPSLNVPCAARGAEGAYPVKAPKRERPTRYGAAFVARARRRRGTAPAVGRSRACSAA